MMQRSVKSGLSSVNWVSGGTGALLLLLVLLAGVFLAPVVMGQERNQGQSLGQRGSMSNENQQLVRLSHSESRDVQQDWLRLSLSVNKEGRDLATLQGELKAVLDSNLQLAKAKEKRGELEVKTGNFSVYPRYSNGNKADGWSGSAELVLEGTDVGAISALAGLMKGMAITSTGFMLSPAQRKRIEGEITEQAIKGFRSKAAQFSQSFGAAGYTVADVQVGMEGAEMPQFRTMQDMAVASSMKSAAPVPVEPGMDKVTVTVSGAIALKP